VACDPSRAGEAPTRHEDDGAVVRAAVEAHLGSRQVARVVYGAIIGLTLSLHSTTIRRPPA
jgi:hypothetical protein